MKAMYAVMSGGACLGTGSTPEAAKIAALRIVPEDTDLSCLPMLHGGRLEGCRCPCLVRCSLRFADAVQGRGGAAFLPYTIAKNGIIDLAGSPGGDTSAARLDEALARLDHQIEEGGMIAGRYFVSPIPFFIKQILAAN
jgi:hypothetical protein